MEDQVQSLDSKEMLAKQISCDCPIVSNYRKLTNDGYVCTLNLSESFFYITPECLQSNQFRKAVKDCPPSIAVADEAHCVLD